MNELLFCKLISNIICICWLTRINVMSNVIFTPFQVKSWLPQWFTHISLLTYIGNRGLGKIFCLLILANGNRGFKVPSTSRSSKLIWVKSKEANQVQTALLQGLPWLICIRENISRL